jgi:hypothetical protein
MSVALIVCPPPSTVVTEAGTVSGDVTSPQSAVSVNVVPLTVPAQTVVMSPPGMEAADAAGANATLVIIHAAASNPTLAPTTPAVRVKFLAM